MSDKSTPAPSTRYVGLGLPTLLFLVFLTLRLTDHIDWPWYAVTAPLWVPWGILLAVVAMFVLVGGVLAIGERWTRGKTPKGYPS